MRDTRLPRRKREPRFSRLLTFVNSSFGVWLLSALFITGAGTGYAAWRDRVARVSKAAQIKTELHYRFINVHKVFEDTALNQIEVLFYRQLRVGINKNSVPYDSSDPSLTKAEVKQQILSEIDDELKRLAVAAESHPSFITLAFDPPSGRYPGLYTEFQDLNLPGLLSLLRDQLSGKQARQIDSYITEISLMRSTDDYGRAAELLVRNPPDFIGEPQKVDRFQKRVRKVFENQYSIDRVKSVQYKPAPADYLYIRYRSEKP